MSEMLFYKGGQMEFVIVRGGKLAFDEHCHASDIVISGITGGYALLTLGGAVRELCKGDIFSVLPYENHSLRSQSPVGMLTMCIKKDLFSQEKAVYTQFVVGAVNGLCGCEGISETEKDIAQKLCEAALTIYDAADELMQSDADELLAGDVQMLQDTPENDADIQTLADNSFVSKYHYIRRFRAVSGLTPNRFRLQNRVRKAQQLIAGGEKITDAAVESGFYDQSHFDRYFKKIVGIPPKEYIRSLRNFVQE
ncbi:MAG: helix-turn-helix transcriptional regulator [Ruminococcus sp.]|nr:helix-turn-helix transcriptional regulator [Ruminococcus sp.]